MVNSSEFQRADLAQGVTLHTLTTGRFKTTTVHVYLHRPLNQREVTRTALLPAVLRRGTERWPTALDLARHLEQLYGAVVDGDVLKKGERQLVQFVLDIPNERYLPGGEKLFRQGLEALAQVLLHPITEGGAFRADYVDQERQKLRERIEGVINDKRTWAVVRCVQEMCHSEPFGLYKLGRAEDLDGIGPQDLIQSYRQLLETAPVDIFVVGNVTHEEAAEVVRDAFRWPQRRPEAVPVASPNPQPREVRRVEDRQPVNQGKLVMGLRTGVRRCGAEYYPLLVANSLLGAGPHSKLFQNVREKASLAYYAYSNLETTKGIMLISAGIEFANYEKALEIIEEQRQELLAGNVTPAEYNAAIRALVLSQRLIEDSPAQKILAELDTTVNGCAEGDPWAGRVGRIESVTLEQAVAAARHIQLDTVYFLNGERGQTAGA